MKITIQTSNGKEYYEINESGGRFYCKKYNKHSFWKNWITIGNSKRKEDALSIVKSDASQSGTIFKILTD